MTSKEMAARLNATADRDALCDLLAEYFAVIVDETKAMLKQRNAHSLPGVLSAWKDSREKWEAVRRRATSVQGIPSFDEMFAIVDPEMAKTLGVGLECEAALVSMSRSPLAGLLTRYRR